MRIWITVLAVTLFAPAARAAGDPNPYVRAALVRLRLNDTARSEKNLYTAILRARKLGSYGKLAAEIRNKPVYRELLASERNAFMLDLFDAEAEGTLTFDEVKEQLREPEALRDALANTVPQAYIEALRPPIRPACEPSVECTALHLERTIAKAHEEFDADRFYSAAGLYTLAITLAEKGADLSKENRHTAMTRRGVSLRALGLLDQSLSALKYALREFPKSSMVHYELAATYSRLGEIRRAQKHLKKCVEYAKKEGTADQAISALKRDPDFDAIKRTKTYARLTKDSI